MMTGVHFSSASTEWATPRKFYEALNEEFGFTFDPCPLGGEVDGRSPLFCDWAGKRVFCNPPYGPEIAKFLKRWREADLAVFLLPARTDTRWFHDECLPNATEIPSRSLEPGGAAPRETTGSPAELL